MTVDHGGRRRALSAAAGLLFGLLWVLLGPASPAHAHAALISSDPAADAVVPVAPNWVTLTFSEDVHLVPDRIQVLDPASERADVGAPQVAGNTVTVPLRPGGGKGTYLISYRVVSADSHPVAGAIAFSVGAPSERPTGADTAAAGDPAVGTLVPVAKFLGYAGLVLLVGPVLVLSLLWPHRLSRRGPARLAWTGFTLVVASTLAGIWLQTPYTLGVGVFDVGVGDLQDVLGSTYGTVLLVRFGVLCAAVLLLRPVLRGAGEQSRADVAVLAVLGLIALATWPLAGHPAASPVVALSVVADAVHLAAVVVWLGGLVMLLAFLLPQANGRELGAILPIWSRWASAAVGALIVGGVVQAVIEVRSFGNLFDTTYGRLVTVKVALALLVIAVAAYARRLVARAAAPTPDEVNADEQAADGDVVADEQAAGGDADGQAGGGDVVTDAAPAGGGDRALVRVLRRTVAIELVITTVIVGVAAALVQIPPSRMAQAVASTAERPTGSGTLRSENFSLQVEIDPAAVGGNSIHLYAYAPDGKPLPVVEWFVTAALPGKGIEPIDVNLLRITDNHVIGDVALPVAGDWVFKFTLRTSDIDQASVSMTVQVA
ncbi:MAG TPA: copper resistance protein CopC [Actinoplanes sp.]|nr:copper resistance protein CopC [Actinoplanes sp.]